MSTVLQQINPFFEEFGETDYQKSNENYVRNLASQDKCAIWYFPRQKQFYMAFDPENPSPPSKDDRIHVADQKIYESNVARLGSLRTASANPYISATELDQIKFGHWKKEFLPLAVEYDSIITRLQNGESLPSIQAGFGRGRSREAGIISMHDYQAIANTVEAQEIIDLRRDDYISQNAVPRRQVDGIEVGIDYRDSEIRVIENVGEFHVSDGQAIDYSGNTYKLKKHQVHMKAGGWNAIVNRKYNVVGDTFGRINEDWPRFYAEKVLRVLLTSTAIAASSYGGAWDVLDPTNFHYTANPKKALQAAEAAIKAGGGRFNTMILNTKTSGVLLQNTHMGVNGLGVLNQSVPMNRSETMSYTHPLVGGVQIYAENTDLLADGVVLTFDSSAVGAYDGAQRTLSYVEGKPFVLGLLVDRWHETFLLRSGLARRITGTVTP